MTQEPKKSQVKEDKPTTAEALILKQGNDIEALLSQNGWLIVEELIDEGVASVSGRKTNGYYYNGSLTRGEKDKQYLTGYQEALTQLYNRIKDFVRLRDKMIEKQKQEKVESSSNDYVNPFMEELDNER